MQTGADSIGQPRIPGRQLGVERRRRVRGDTGRREGKTARADPAVPWTYSPGVGYGLVGRELREGKCADQTRNPFNDRVIASGSDDGKVFIWQVPQGFSLYSDAEEPTDVAPVSKLTGHSRYGSSQIEELF